MYHFKTKAKINLHLHLVHQREDGYHELQSVMAFADIGDDVSIEPADQLSLTIDGPFAEGLSTDDNLMLRAANLLKPNNNSDIVGAKMHLTKNLPVASGIGGGSGDAAAVMHLLNDMWKCQLSLQELQSLGVTLGADIPICLQQQASLVKGIGEKVTPVRIPENTYILLINPLKPISTGAIFTSEHKEFSGSIEVDLDLSKPTSFEGFLQQSCNDLQPPASHILPEITMILEQIQIQEGCFCARMTGSGATCFGLFGKQDLAEKAKKTLKSHFFNHYWIEIGKLS